MSAQQQPSLFATTAMPLAEQINLLEKSLNNKCMTYHVSFGIFKAKRGPVDHNAMIVLTDNKGQHFNATMSANSIHDLLAQVNDSLSTINK